MKKFTLALIAVCILFTACNQESVEYTETLLFSENFETIGKWTATDTAQYERYVDNGKYHMRINNPGYIMASFVSDVYNPPDENDLINFSFEADLTLEMHSPENRGYIGMLFNFVNWQNHDVFVISPFGSYAIWRYTNGVKSSVVDWESSDSINSYSKTNTIKIYQRSASIVIEANEKELLKISHEALNKASDLGFCSSLDENATIPITAVIDNVKISSLKK